MPVSVVDEVWSFVGNKKCRRWLWSAWEPRLKRILAHTFGTRSKKTLKKLASFNIVFWGTDNFKAYNLLPKNQHLVGKTFTQRIERENLTLRNRLKRLNRKTLGYSKSPEMHDKVIRTFIEREYYI
ncbi:insertion element IS1 protein InsB [Xenorhabdus japonica]|uniref:Insertion element IS1 protein InsB n=1 Tax=Xenorhabdus japonica TaxID=53341 RepID=A0A1I5CD40_9GAMM|nr:insertion element IS1 protein InsB [Xenorhabdus japonica]